MCLTTSLTKIDGCPICKSELLVHRAGVSSCLHFEICPACGFLDFIHSQNRSGNTSAAVGAEMMLYIFDLLDCSQLKEISHLLPKLDKSERNNGDFDFSNQEIEQLVRKQVPNPYQVLEALAA